MHGFYIADYISTVRTTESRDSTFGARQSRFPAAFGPFHSLRFSFQGTHFVSFQGIGVVFFIQLPISVLGYLSLAYRVIVLMILLTDQEF